MTILYTGARAVYPAGEWDAFSVRGGVFTWVGREADAPRASKRVGLDGRVVTPGFVDAHAHLTMTGLTLSGVDLHGVRNVAAMARRLADYSGSGFVYGAGWDDSTWDAQPSAAMIERAAAGRHVYLSRVDGHSALVSHALFDAAGCAGLEGVDPAADGRPSGIVRRDAHHAVRSFFFQRMPLSQIRGAHRAAAEAAVAKGITTVHDMGGPVHGAGERDLDAVLAAKLPVNVVCYYASDDMTIATDRGLNQIGGDWNADGSLGSRTAALNKSYSDRRGHKGFLYNDARSLGRFFADATRHGLQAGVHCIGDAACEAAVAGLERAAKHIGAAKVRAMRHRLEHFEMASEDQIMRAARLGAVFSVQPAFDAWWGGPDGMYRARLGPRRARAMNDFKTMLWTGNAVGFGSDCPITPFDPLGGIRAAVEPSNPKHAITIEEAFYAATAGASALATEAIPAGAIAEGRRADFVVWDDDPIRSRRPRIRATIARGKVVYGLMEDR